MLFLRLRHFLMAPLDQSDPPCDRGDQALKRVAARRLSERCKASVQVGVWLALNLGVALYYGSLGLRRAFRTEYVVQDDAREYVFWMQQFVDPAVLPHDLIADYFKSITPLGYAAIYHLVAMFAIEPLVLSKILPILLGAIATLYGFGICLRLFPVPVAGFVAMVLLNQSLWFRDDLSSATPRAFVYPLFLAFLYYLVRNQRLGVIVTVVLQALIYPPLVLIAIALLFLRLWEWQRWRRPRFQPQHLLVFGWAASLGGLALLPYAVSSAEFSPIVTAAEAWTMPELHPGGRHPYFDGNRWQFWLTGQHSGILPPLLPPLIWAGVALPFMVRSQRFPLAVRLRREAGVLTQTALVSLGLFFAAHAVLLKLFFPTRYTTHTWRMVLAIAAGIVLTIGLDALLVACETLATSHRWISVGWRVAIAGALGALLMLFPAMSREFPATNYRASGEAALYEFLQQQPLDSLIATLSDEANNIPTFAKRSVLVGKEYALPFHLGFYRQIRQRTLELIEAQYSPDLAPMRQVIRKYGVDFWLLDRGAFVPEYLQHKSWLQSFQPAFDHATLSLQQGKIPGLTTQIKACSAFESESVIVLRASCLDS